MQSQRIGDPVRIALLVASSTAASAALVIYDANSNTPRTLKANEILVLIALNVQVTAENPTLDILNVVAGATSVTQNTLLLEINTNNISGFVWQDANIDAITGLVGVMPSVLASITASAYTITGVGLVMQVQDAGVRPSWRESLVPAGTPLG